MGVQLEGIEAEQWLLKKMCENDIDCFQPDALSKENGRYVLNEIKNQEYYEAPPFDGHGLPKWQIKARLSFFNQTNIRCRLIIKEKGEKVVYWQWLDELEMGDYYDTKGDKPRRVYPIYCFNRTTEDDMFKKDYKQTKL